MAYRNKTYVIFDGDKDQWAYRFMRGWIENDRMAFDFDDAHDLKPLRETSSEATVKARLRERMKTSTQVIVLVGESTRHLYKYVRWEIELAIELDLPIIVVNLNDKRYCDEELCPPVLRDRYTIHVPFKAKMIQHALDDFPDAYYTYRERKGPYHYNDETYRRLGL